MFYNIKHKRTSAVDQNNITKIFPKIYKGTGFVIFLKVKLLAQVNLLHYIHLFYCLSSLTRKVFNFQDCLKYGPVSSLILIDKGLTEFRS